MAVPVRAPASGQRRTASPLPRHDGAAWGCRHRGAHEPAYRRAAAHRPRRAARVARILLPGVRLLSLVGPGGAGKTSLALTLAVHALVGLPGWCLRGAAGVAGHGGSGSRRGRGRARHADGRCRRRTRRPRAALQLPRQPAAAAACRQLRARRRCGRRTGRRHPGPLRRRHDPGHQPRSARRTRRGPGQRRARLRLPPKTRPWIRCSTIRPPSCSSNGPARLDRGPSSTSPTSSPSAESPAPWTACRSPSSWPRPGRARCRRSRSRIGWTTGSRCSPPARGPPKHDSRRSAPPSTGATPC